MKKSVTNSPYFMRLQEFFSRQIISNIACITLLVSIFLPRASLAQGTGAFIENNGLVVMETESAVYNTNWKFESTLPGFTGAGYLRYNGSNHLSTPGFDIIEYDVVIEHPGEYKMFLFSSHIDAPESDQNNDSWTKMDDGEWIKTVHPSAQQPNGFTFHTQWVQNFGAGEVFSDPTYQLDAGVHTFFISGRSFNYRMDRIHLWKNDAPFKVSYDVASQNTHPESERDNTVLTVSPNPITFGATATGVSSQLVATLNNGGDTAINVSSISFTGANASDFGSNFSGSLTVPSNGSANLNVTFGPLSQGSKVATLVINHNGLNSPTTVNLFGTATSGGSGTSVLFRVNAGGPLVSDPEGDWAADQAVEDSHANGTADPGTPHPYVNAVATGDWTFGRSDVVTADFTVPPGTPTAIFSNGRWDPGNAPTQQWDIPINAGIEIEVRLYFAEQLFEGVDTPPGLGWPRIFDVQIDGVIYPAFDDLNIFEEVGHDVGMMRSVVLISDGNLDIDFLNNSHDPIIQGIEVLAVGSISRALNEGWNMVGVPTNPPSDNYAAVFDEVSPLDLPFLWNGNTYAQSSTVTAGVGYWIKIPAGAVQSFTDEAVNSLNLTLSAGWNMISGPACVVLWGDISDPGNILIDETLYGYSDGYVTSTSLLPGAGYWVRTSGAGAISMDCGAAGKVTRINQAEGINLDNFGLLRVADNRGMSQELYFGGTLAEGVDVRSFSMPPKGQAGDFDVRFHNSSRLSEASEHIVRMQSSAYPVVVKLDRKPVDNFGFVKMEELVNGEVVKTHTVQADEEITISNAQVDALRITSGDGLTETLASLPETFTLQGNYPNPFNPSTQVVFDMPEAGIARIEVYDLLGRNVMSVPAQDIAAGAGRRLMVDASSLASGTYLYHLRVEMASQSVTKVGRMTLIK